MNILDILKQKIAPLFPGLAGGSDSDQGGAPTPARPDGLAGGLMGSGTTPQPAAQPAQPAQQPQVAEQAIRVPDDGSVPSVTTQAEQPTMNMHRAIPASAPADQPQPSTAAPQDGDMGLAASAPSHGPSALHRALTRRDKLEQDISALEGKDYSAPTYVDPSTGQTSKKARPGYVLEKEAGKNYDKNHNILDVLKGIGLGALSGGMRGGFAGLLTGAAAGGIGAGIDRNYDDKTLDDIKRDWLHQDMARENAYETGNFKRDQAEAQAIDAQQEPGRKNAKVLSDIEKNQADILEKQANTKDKQERLKQDALKQTLGLKYYDPKRPDHRAIAEQAGINPDSIPAFDDRNLVDRQLDDGTKVRVSGADALKAEVESKQFDATKTQDITKFNAENSLKVQDKNVSNEMKYQDDVRAVLTKVAEGNADLIAGNAEAQEANNRMQSANSMAQAAAQNGDDETFEKAKKDFDSASAAFGKALGKSQGGAALAQQIRKAMPTRPGKITYQPVKPATVGPLQKKVSKARDPLGLFR